MSTKLKRTLWIAGAILVLIAAYLLYAFVFKPQPEAYTPSITDAEGNVIPGSIAVIETVILGGSKQTITIRGVDTANPVLLFLHGGPGMPSSPWATWNGYHASLEEHFLLVHWSANYQRLFLPLIFCPNFPSPCPDNRHIPGHFSGYSPRQFF